WGSSDEWQHRQRTVRNTGPHRSDQGGGAADTAGARSGVWGLRGADWGHRQCLRWWEPGPAEPDAWRVRCGWTACPHVHGHQHAGRLGQVICAEGLRHGAGGWASGRAAVATGQREAGLQSPWPAAGVPPAATGEHGEAVAAIAATAADEPTEPVRTAG